MRDEAKQKLSYSSLIPPPSSLYVPAQLKQAVLTCVSRFVYARDTATRHATSKPARPVPDACPHPPDENSRRQPTQRNPSAQSSPARDPANRRAREKGAACPASSSAAR